VVGDRAATIAVVAYPPAEAKRPQRILATVAVACLAATGLAAGVSACGGNESEASAPATIKRHATTAQLTSRHPTTRPSREPKGALRPLIEAALPVYCGAGKKRQVALTFDDGPGPYTIALVRLLRRANAQATFFLVGNRIARWLGGARAEAALGELGDHTWGHHLLPALARDNAVWQIEWARREILLRTGEFTALFRPPYGQLQRPLWRFLRAKGMIHVLWSIDGRDYLPGASPRSILATVETGLRPGAIVILHEIHPPTIAATRLLLAELRRRRLTPVTVSRLLRTDPPSRAQLRAGIAGC